MVDFKTSQRVFTRGKTLSVDFNTSHSVDFKTSHGADFKNLIAQVRTLLRGVGKDRTMHRRDMEWIGLLIWGYSKDRTVRRRDMEG